MDVFVPQCWAHTSIFALTRRVVGGIIKYISYLAIAQQFFLLFFLVALGRKKNLTQIGVRLALDGKVILGN